MWNPDSAGVVALETCSFRREEIYAYRNRQQFRQKIRMFGVYRPLRRLDAYVVGRVCGTSMITNNWNQHYTHVLIVVFACFDGFVQTDRVIATHPVNSRRSSVLCISALLRYGDPVRLFCCWTGIQGPWWDISPLAGVKICVRPEGHHLVLPTVAPQSQVSLAKDDRTPRGNRRGVETQDMSKPTASWYRPIEI